jgi:signal transduction histidine kinase
MRRWRLRTKFLLWMVVISAAVTSTTLLLVRREVENQLRRQIVDDLRNSVSTFQNVQNQRQASLRRTAELLADLPISRALMTTSHPATIQEGSEDLWRLAGTDLLIMADRSGNVLGLRTNNPTLGANAASESLRATNAGADSWWFGGGHLYEVSVQPIYLGAPTVERITGFLGAGSDVDERAARELSDVAGVEVAFWYGDQLVRSTLGSDQNSELARSMHDARVFSSSRPLEVRIAGEPFLVSAVSLKGESAQPVRLVVLKSLTETSAFVSRMNALLLGLGLMGLVAGTLVVFLITRAFTRPLDRLVDGVRALGGGDYEYPLPAGGDDEIAELTSAFARMRTGLRESQKVLLQAERLATIGRMASSISHDLRHHLVAVLANAEFLMGNRKPEERQELYIELRAEVGQMTDLIESLLELSKPRDSLRLSRVSLDGVVQRAVQMVRAYTKFCEVEVSVNLSPVEGWFDPNKLQRVIQNLLVNAAEAVSPTEGGNIQVLLVKRDHFAEIRVSDSGRGIPDDLRDKVFDAFVSYGKENGTGLGLTVVQKIVQDHGGTACVESTSTAGTVMLVSLPLAESEDPQGVRTKVSAPTIAPG